MEERQTSKKRAVIPISSSSSSSGEEFYEESESESESEFSVEEISSSACSDDDENYVDDDDRGEENGRKDEESMSSRVVRLLRERNYIEELTLIECKAYLRSHGLRLSGTRAECVQRIKEHWRIRDGGGEIQYPRSSFAIDCTGDVCRGDVVLFTQKVYKKKFDKITRSGKVLGKRTVAGRIVKESYGAAKQQHTFTVEVLWSRGIQELPPLFPLLVKGRNLYRLKTFRQRWKNEKERSEVLAEKHKRGAAARQIRDMRRTKAAERKGMKFSSKEVSKRQKRSLHSSISEAGKEPASRQESRLHGKAPAANRNGAPFEQSNYKGKRKLSSPASQRRHQNYFHRPDVAESSVLPYGRPKNFSFSQSNQYHQESPCFFPYEDGSASARNRRSFASQTNPFFTPFSAHEGLVSYDIHPNYGYYPNNAGRQRDANCLPEFRGTFQQFPFSSRR